MRDFRRWGFEIFEIVVLALAIVYAALALCPSSYSKVLRDLGVKEDGLLAFQPRIDRTDEFASWTPAIQAVVDADFGQVNVTSLYRESHRHLLPMPLFDWGMAFKPFFWPFLALPPAWAYSAYFALLYVTFLLGWYRLFRRLGQPPSWACAATLLLFFCSYTQAWWTSLGQHLGLAPWLFLLGLGPLKPWPRFAATAWLGSVFLLGLTFYPPLLLNLGLVLLLGCWLLQPATAAYLRDRPRLLATAGGLVVALVITWLYLHEALGKALVSAHGLRNVAGGMVPFRDFLGLFFPMVATSGDQPVRDANYCETATAGSYLWLLILALVDVRESRRRWQEEPDATLRRATLCALAFGALMAAWMLFPLPAWLGAPLLWNKMPSTRLLFPAGLLLLLLALAWLPRLSFRPRGWQLGLAVLAVVAAWWPTRWWPGLAPAPLGPVWLAVEETIGRRNADLYVIPAAALLLADWAWRRRRDAEAALTPAGILVVALVVNAVAFAGVNPLMSARPIFDRPWSPRLDSLKAMQDAHPDKVLVNGHWGILGRIANGYGFRSVNHSFIVPEYEYWRRRYAQLPEAKLKDLFQRYHLLQVEVYLPPLFESPLLEPTRVGGDLTIVPAVDFLPVTPLTVAPAGTLPPVGLPAVGEVRVGPIGTAGTDWLLTVMGEINGFTGHSAVQVWVDRPAEIVAKWHRPRWHHDLDAGIRLYSRMDMRLRVEPGEGKPALCVVTSDPELGTFALAPPTESPFRSYCPKVKDPHPPAPLSP